MTKCALVAAVISSALMAVVALSGSVPSGANAGLGGTTQQRAETGTAVTAPAASPR